MTAFRLAGQTQGKVTLTNAASSHLEGTETCGTEDVMSHWGITGVTPYVAAGCETSDSLSHPSTHPNQSRTQRASGGEHRKKSLRVHAVCSQHLGAPAPPATCTWSWHQRYSHLGKLKVKLPVRAAKFFRHLCFNLKSI